MKKGFTLIELLITISIIGILTGFSLVAFNGTKASARDGKRKADLISISSALEMYRADNSGYPITSNLSNALTGGTSKYMDSIPTDPTSTHSYSYKSCNTAPCSTYTLCAGLELVTAGDTACTSAPSANCGTGITCSYHVSNP